MESCSIPHPCTIFSLAEIRIRLHLSSGELWSTSSRMKYFHKLGFILLRNLSSLFIQSFIDISMDTETLILNFVLHQYYLFLLKLSQHWPVGALLVHSDFPLIYCHYFVSSVHLFWWEGAFLYFLALQGDPGSSCIFSIQASSSFCYFSLQSWFLS